MFRIMWNGTSGMYANQEKLDAISNDLANLETVGYKSEQVSFSNLMYETLKKDGYPVSSGKSPSTGTGVKADNWIRDNSEGTITQTNNNTDFAIDGEGYFRVTTQDGSKAYERNGQFSVNANGNLVDGNGNLLDIQYNDGVNPNSVKFTDSNIVVTEDGSVGIKDAQSNITGVGKINLYNAVGDNSMSSAGNNLFVPNQGVQMNQVTGSKIKQGYIEGSNVDLATSMTDMIKAQRAYEISSKSVKTADEMWGMVNSLASK